MFSPASFPLLLRSSGFAAFRLLPASSSAVVWASRGAHPRAYLKAQSLGQTELFPGPFCGDLRGRSPRPRPPRPQAHRARASRPRDFTQGLGNSATKLGSQKWGDWGLQPPGDSSLLRPRRSIDQWRHGSSGAREAPSPHPCGKAAGCWVLSSDDTRNLRTNQPEVEGKGNDDPRRFKLSSRAPTWRLWSPRDPTVTPGLPDAKVHTSAPSRCQVHGLSNQVSRKQTYFKMNTLLFPFFELFFEWIVL
jgi:hypothetical protein